MGRSRREEFTDRNCARGSDSEVTGSIPSQDTAVNCFNVIGGSADEPLRCAAGQFKIL